MNPPSPDSGSTRFSAARRLASLRHALRGLRYLIATEHNAWIHFAATAAVIAVGWALHLSRFEWCWIIVATALVWVAEACNTALETLADEVSEEFNHRIGRAKDLGAAAVLVASGAAFLIGVGVFLPYFVRYVR